MSYKPYKTTEEWFEHYLWVHNRPIVVPRAGQNSEAYRSGWDRIFGQTEPTNYFNYIPSDGT